MCITDHVSGHSKTSYCARNGCCDRVTVVTIDFLPSNWSARHLDCLYRPCYLLPTLHGGLHLTGLKMSKRAHSPDSLPDAKRAHGLESSSRHHISPSSFNALYDEVILVIFSYLSYNDLCTVQPVNRDWSRLALDNQVRAPITEYEAHAKCRSPR